MSILDLYRQSNCTIPTDSDILFLFPILSSHAKRLSEQLLEHFNGELVQVSIKNETFQDIYVIESRDTQKRIDIEFSYANSKSIISESKYRPSAPHVMTILCKVWTSGELVNTLKLG